jgi:hypothetical protein
MDLRVPTSLRPDSCGICGRVLTSRQAGPVSSAAGSMRHLRASPSRLVRRAPSRPCPDPCGTCGRVPHVSSGWPRLVRGRIHAALAGETLTSRQAGPVSSVAGSMQDLRRLPLVLACPAKFEHYGPWGLKAKPVRSRSAGLAVKTGVRRRCPARCGNLSGERP